MDEEQKVMVILHKIKELSEEKRRIAGQVEDLMGSLCGVSARIGELQAELKTQQPCKN